MRKITVIEPKKSTAVRKVRVAAYCRVSTEKSDQANSYDTQKTYFMNSYSKAANEEIVEIYADLGSGTSELYRPEFTRMINDCRLGKIDRIVTKSLSRFARNTRPTIKSADFLIFEVLTLCNKAVLSPKCDSIFDQPFVLKRHIIFLLIDLFKCFFA